MPPVWSVGSPFAGAVLTFPREVLDAGNRTDGKRGDRVHALCIAGDSMWFVSPGLGELYDRADAQQTLFVAPMEELLASDSAIHVQPHRVDWPAYPGKDDSDIAAKPIRALCTLARTEGGKTTLWVGTKYHGIARFRLDGGKWTGRWFTGKDGLPVREITLMAAGLCDGRRALAVTGTGGPSVGKEGPETVLWSMDEETGAVLLLGGSRKTPALSAQMLLRWPDGLVVPFEFYDRDKLPGRDVSKAAFVASPKLHRRLLKTLAPDAPDGQRSWCILNDVCPMDRKTFAVAGGPPGGMGPGATPYYDGQTFFIVSIPTSSNQGMDMPGPSPVEAVAYCAAQGSRMWLAMGDPNGGGICAIAGYSPAPTDKDWDRNDEWIAPIRLPGGGCVRGILADSKHLWISTTADTVVRLDCDAVVQKARPGESSFSSAQWRKQYDGGQQQTYCRAVADHPGQNLAGRDRSHVCHCVSRRRSLGYRVAFRLAAGSRHEGLPHAPKRERFHRNAVRLRGAAAAGPDGRGGDERAAKDRPDPDSVGATGHGRADAQRPSRRLDHAKGKQLMQFRISDFGFWIAACLAMLCVTASALGQSQTTTLSAGPTTKPDHGKIYPLPITFGRSGKTVEVELSPASVAFGTIVLRAYGRAWTEPSKDPKFKVPAVRVPTVFSITPADQPGSVLGELVAYPDRDVEWDKKITLYALGAPPWFNQWSAATGLPVKQIKPADLASAKLAPPDEKAKSLLILGQDSAGKDLPDVAKLAKAKDANVLVLDARWFGDAAPSVNIEPKHMQVGLAEVAKQHWPAPLKFASHRQPWPGIANRWAWIVDDDGLPLVENVWLLTDKPTHPTVLSYVPWQFQLGRSEVADSMLSSILSAVASAKPPPSSYHAVSICGYHGVAITAWPEDLRWKGGETLTRPGQTPKRPFKESRPVVSAILNDPPITDAGPLSISVLDLRGDQALTQETRQSIEKTLMPDGWSSLLILGDDKMLDEWKWLKLDRAKKTINRPGVVWLSDDELPPPKSQQIKLMLKLTELGVPLAPPHEQEMGK